MISLKILYDNLSESHDNLLNVYRDELLDLLLTDKTSNKNILWCTDSYKNLGPEYESNKEILPSSIFLTDGNLVKSRIRKSKEELKQRIKFKGEVFTPSWVCNHQINIIDEIWFGDRPAFNVEVKNGWRVNSNKISFSNKPWEEYISDIRIEITGGEGPYIVSRYDSVTGDLIEVKSRIGILDRKLRIIGENTSSTSDWFDYVVLAYKSVYSFELQGDSLLIFRENLIYTFLDYYFEKFNNYPDKNMVLIIAEIISWNFWQMDGMNYVIPDSCNSPDLLKQNLFGEVSKQECSGCIYELKHEHIGIYSCIMDWKENKVIRFVDLLLKGGLYES